MGPAGFIPTNRRDFYQQNAVFGPVGFSGQLDLSH